MEHYVGLDVSLKLTAICIVDRTGKFSVKEWFILIQKRSLHSSNQTRRMSRGSDSNGATSTWLWTELNKMGLPVICSDARHAKAALKMQINKSDRNDAVGIAASCNGMV